ncbi:MAG: VCBS repeat-containing protein [Phycisphaerales bacterium]|nr:VCBS repeat-containing protein [Phycisphaerales bacterium]
MKISACIARLSQRRWVVAGLGLSLAWGAWASAVPFGPQVVITGTFIDARTVIAADVNGDGHLDPIGASLGSNKVSWFQNSGTIPPTFTERIITTNARDARECFAIDMDFDGDIDVIVASRQDDKIAWHENVNGDGTVWVEHIVSTSVIGSWSAWAEDMDGDGDLDVLSAGRDDNRISWHENLDGSGTSWTRHIVSSSANRAQKAVAADVDGDGDMDMLSASGADAKIAWYENVGGSPPQFVTRVIVTNASNAKWVKTADIDGDGRLDVLSASEGNSQIRWYRNLGGSPPTFQQFTVSVISGAKVVEPVDFDLDGDIDLLSCGIGLDQIAYHENLGGNPVAWSTYIISTAADNPLTVYPADLDNDGDPDLLSASFMDNKIAWYENRSIHRGFRYASLQSVLNAGASNGPWGVSIGDLDRDGAPDLVTAFPYTNTILWHRNLGGTPMQWSAHAMTTTAPTVRSVVIADVNADGAPDVVAATEGDNSISVFYSNGAAIPTFTRSIVYPFIPGARAVQVADLDQDGDLDIASVGRAGDVVAWHENSGATPPSWTTHTITNAADGAEAVAMAKPKCGGSDAGCAVRISVSIGRKAATSPMS